MLSNKPCACIVKNAHVEHSRIVQLSSSYSSCNSGLTLSIYFHKNNYPVNADKAQQLQPAHTSLYSSYTAYIGLIDYRQAPCITMTTILQTSPFSALAIDVAIVTGVCLIKYGSCEFFFFFQWNLFGHFFQCTVGMTTGC